MGTKQRRCYFGGTEPRREATRAGGQFRCAYRFLQHDFSRDYRAWLFVGVCRTNCEAFHARPSGCSAFCRKLPAASSVYGNIGYAYGMVMLQAFNGAGDTVTPNDRQLFRIFGCWKFHWPTSWRFPMHLAGARARIFPLWRRKLRSPRSVLFYSNKGAGKKQQILRLVHEFRVAPRDRSREFPFFM